jgi:toxin HigB-1
LDIQFRRKKEEELYTHEKGAHKYPPGVVDAFFEAMTIIKAATDEREFYTVRSLRAKKLEGNRKGQWSVRLSKQLRLILVISPAEQGYCAEIIEIVDYH